MDTNEAIQLEEQQNSQGLGNKDSTSYVGNSTRSSSIMSVENGLAEPEVDVADDGPTTAPLEEKVRVSFVLGMQKSTRRLFLISSFA